MIYPLLVFILIFDLSAAQHAQLITSAGANQLVPIRPRDRRLSLVEDPRHERRTSVVDQNLNVELERLDDSGRSNTPSIVIHMPPPQPVAEGLMHHLEHQLEVHERQEIARARLKTKIALITAAVSMATTITTLAIHFTSQCKQNN